MARLIVRVGFGLALAFVGFSHYQDPLFAESVGRGLGMLESLGMIWGYILPGLMIAGGLLLAFGIYMNIAAYLSAIALASIPAGLMLKSAMGIPLEDTMPMAMTALIWIIVLLQVTKGKHGCCDAAVCNCGPNGDCGCGCDPSVPSSMPSKPAMPVVKSAPVAPVATVKTAPVVKKSVPVKKVSSKKPAPKSAL